MIAFFASLSHVFSQRMRGLRAVNLAAGLTVLVLALGVYAFKADTGKESTRIFEVEQSIAEESKAVHLLRAEVAHLEQPERLERLSAAYLGLQPLDPRREASVDSLGELSRKTPSPAPAPSPVAPAAPAPAQSSPTGASR